MKDRWCKTCVKRKTIYCPNIDKCFEKEEKTYYQDKFMLLEENQKLIEDIIGYEQERNNLIKSIPFKENKKLKNQQKEFIEYLENEKNRLAKECSHTYEDSLGKLLYVNEDIFNEVNKILSKYKEIIGGDNK